jgi:hypothetical protein
MPPLIVSFRARQGVPAPTEDRASYVLLGLSSPQAGLLIAHHARRQPSQPLEAVQRRTVCARRASRGPTGGFAQAALLVNTRIQAGRTRALYAWRANTAKKLLPTQTQPAQVAPLIHGLRQAVLLAARACAMLDLPAPTAERVLPVLLARSRISMDPPRAPRARQASTQQKRQARHASRVL